MITDWIVAIAAVIALMLSIYNLLEQRKAEQRRLTERQEDRRPQVRITAKKALEHVAKTTDIEIYSCNVTNVGMVGVTVDSVLLEAPNGGGIGIPLQLPKGERQRKLEPGESQSWGIYMDDIQIEGPNEIPVVAVVRDTAGNEHRSNPEDMLPLRGS